MRTEQLTKENSGLQQEVQTQKELIEQLELDLSSLQNLSTANRGEAEVRTPFAFLTADRSVPQCSS